MINYCGSYFQFPSSGVNVCCKEHDENYSKKIGFWKSNLLFAKCMFRKNGFGKMVIYFLGVMVFGWFAYWIKPTLKNG